MNDFPKVYENEVKAILNAIDFSDKDRNHFYYVLFNNAGKYLIDMIGIVHSNEKLLLTIYKGSVQWAKQPFTATYVGMT